MYRFIASEKWRTEFGTNSLITDFEYPEKAEVFEYYPQFYHKTDKVGILLRYSHGQSTRLFDRQQEVVELTCEVSLFPVY